MKRILVIVCLLTAAIYTESFGQLTERYPLTRKINQDARPEAGNIGFTLAPSTADAMDVYRAVTGEDRTFKGLTLFYLNYYLTDEIELTLGTTAYSKTRRLKGELLDDIGVDTDITKTASNRFAPGANYHFSSLNWFDTYAGAGLIFGRDKDEVVENETTNLTGDFFSTQYTKNSFVFGFDIHFGMRAFIADTPIAIGFEWGLQGIRNTKEEYKIKEKSSVGGVTTSQTYYSDNIEGTVVKYSSLDFNRYDLGSNARVSISYFFRR